MNVLCVCEGNTCLSPMMEKIVQVALGSKHKVESCGVLEGAKNSSKPNLFSIVTIARNLPGHSVEEHKSRHIIHIDLDRFHHIICVGKTEADIVSGMGAPAKKIHVMEVSNPEKQDLQAYQACFEEIVNKVQKWVDAI